LSQGLEILKAEAMGYRKKDIGPFTITPSCPGEATLRRDKA